MAGSFGGTIKLQGESEYRKALSEITSNLKVLSSEMKVVTSQYSGNANSLKSLGSQNEVLNKKIAEQKEKVNILTKALEESKQETGENSTTTKKWQVELNNANAELNSLTKKVDDNNESIEKSLNNLHEHAKGVKAVGEESEESGKHVLKLGDIIKANLISDAIKSGIKAVTEGFKQLGSAVINAGKESLNSYADYEQLVGGVETLFKDSAGVVENYANNAYKTSGLSANEYMETVTSFSASLLQSLDGDTAKSAKVADMAITDMSDNANKMGTDMSMIQSAYQGFAKQNYTMLDNLKLGYGGTKGEMERLLSDATKLSGVKYDISSLNDVYEAIHIVQGKLGITGTTAKEASTTIQGSLASMKSSWKNLLTGIADENADFGTLINNFVESIVGGEDGGGILSNMLPRVQEILEGMGTMSSGLLEELFPQLLTIITDAITEMLPTLLNSIQIVLQGIVEIFPEIVSAFSTIIPDIAALLISLLPQILEAGIQVIVSLIQGLSQSLPTLIPVIIEAVTLMFETLLDNIDLLIDAGIELILALADGLIDALPKLIDKIPVIIDKLILALTNNLPKLVQGGITLILKLSEGLIKAIPQLVSKLPQIIVSIVNGLMSGIGSISEVGLNMVRGLWNGISDATGWIVDKIKGFGSSIMSGIKSFFGIHSPSTLFRDEIGSNLALGLGEGFGDTMNDVSKEMASSIPTEFDTTINAKNQSSSSINSSSNVNMVQAFKEALSQMKIELDDEVAGRFVEKTITDLVYN